MVQLFNCSIVHIKFFVLMDMTCYWHYSRANSFIIDSQNIVPNVTGYEKMAHFAHVDNFTLLYYIYCFHMDAVKRVEPESNSV